MTASSDRLLRRTLWGNAAFSVISGAILVAFASPFAAIAAHEPVSVAGLGLAIVKHVCESHGGEAAVWSRVGEGSTFTMRLPAIDAGSDAQAAGSRVEATA